MINMNEQLPQYFNESPYIKPNSITYRQYQSNIVAQCKNKNSLIVLPTGLGKTIIGILLIAHALEKYHGLGKVLILAPTRPLVSQHKSSCQKFLNIEADKIVALTGKIPPLKRFLLFNNSRILISTPQVIKNDLLRGRYNLSQVSLIVFDEAHRTRGNYAYTDISKEYIKNCSDPIILGLTASPGKNHELIQKLCTDLFIEEIIFKTREDEDVKSYIYPIETIIKTVDLPLNMLEINEIWNHLFENFLRFFKKAKLLNPYKNYFSKLDFLRICHDLTFALKFNIYSESNSLDNDIAAQLYYKDPTIIEIVKANKLDIQSIFSHCSTCISILHAKDLLQIQDISLFKSFLERVKYKAAADIISAKRIVSSPHFTLVSSLLHKDKNNNCIHPKIFELFSIIKEEKSKFHNKKIIVFAQFREMAEFLKNILKYNFADQYIIEKFIGQANRPDDCGYSQNIQIDLLEKFRNDEIDILIATSVAEEGLDIPNVDAIIFYEPIPSEIRLIQRRGRTGRFSPGRCYILITNNSVDVPFYKAASRKEELMNQILTEPYTLTLCNELNRKELSFSQDSKSFIESDYVSDFKEISHREKDFLTNKSMEEIITEIDNFSNSIEYSKFKEFGVSFYSDFLKLDNQQLKDSILKIKGKQQAPRKPQKKYLNKNLKTLINLAKSSNKNKIKFSDLKALAQQEGIGDKKFFIHFNQACHLGLFQKEGEYITIFHHID